MPRVAGGAKIGAGPFEPQIHAGDGRALQQIFLGVGIIGLVGVGRRKQQFESDLGRLEGRDGDLRGSGLCGIGDAGRGDGHDCVGGDFGRVEVAVGVNRSRRGGPWYRRISGVQDRGDKFL